MNVLFSIKPKFVEKMANGEKLYEFRKTIFRNKKIRKAYIYSSSPTKKIVGFFDIGTIIEDHPERLWEQYNEVSGIDKQDFFRYFMNKEKGFAIEIEKLKMFSSPLDPHEVINNFTPPQSFCYVDQIE